MIYTINKKFQSNVERSKRVLEIAEAFGLVLGDKEFVVFDNLQLEVRQGDIVYITGQSGGGKSLLLKELESQMRLEGKNVVNLDHIVLPEEPLINQIGVDTHDATRLMTIAGLTDAYLWVRKPSELSDGQRYRFKLAKAIESKAEVWVVDEFMAILDRTAAKVVAMSVQKLARKLKTTLLVATTHSDMVDDLQPDLYIDKRYREQLYVERKTESE